MPTDQLLPEYHNFAHKAAAWLSFSYDEAAPAWLHPALHLVLVLVPMFLAVSTTFLALRALYFRLKPVAPNRDVRPLHEAAGLHHNLVSQIVRTTRDRQVCLIVLSLSLMPLLFLSLELPKQIVNNGLDNSQDIVSFAGYSLTQIQFLVVLSVAYFLTITLNGLGKYKLNVLKGRVAERCLRRLRLFIYRGWRNQKHLARKSELPQVLGQEIEPIGGMAADLITLPVMQGGSLATILTFMFMQDPILGFAAVTVLPVQLFLLPYIQRIVNRLVHVRIQEMRILSRCLARQFDPAHDHPRDVLQTAASLRRLEEIRWRIHRVKFLAKALNNFLTALTPFVFYTLGGYFVIQERITLGALIAVLAAYKDFSAPLKELFRFYQQFEDTRIRYKAVYQFLDEHPSRA
ncbi:ABC transporter ATP-binding protein [Ruegeria sp. Alg231-54]|uniref:ABC transporter ATP-binding protein n=1 Tax=Ruegeria sp. Alg231-54 TaxID=1922221 RepID=UPI000D55E632|nr:ABC transporter ATP-binding protein [Ruegeria sp. Alg231-54]